MKKIVTGCLMIVLLFLFFAGCGDNRTGPGGEVVDHNRTQLNVANFDGGIGSTWLYNAKAAFEEKYKDESFEEGKKGVQLMITKGKTSYTSTMETSNFHVIFEEAMSYFDLASSGRLLPITDIVTELNSEDNKKIEDKLSAEQKSTFTAFDGEYYALPHYEFYGGVVYDIDVFESKRLYFADDKDNGNDGFIINLNQKKSAGPDGIYNTLDDGLPSTYEEFFDLIDFMISKKGVTPFVWTGQYNDYVNYMMQALFLNYSGKDEALYNVSFNSNDKTTQIVTGFNQNNTPIIDNRTITPQTGYLLSQQAAKYYALDFLKNILSKNAYHPRSTTGTTSHTDAQELFVYGYAENKPIGMLIEGSYWYNEAQDTGTVQRAIDDFGERAENRRYGWMSLPGIVSGTVNGQNNTKLTLGDLSDSYAIINANIKDTAHLVRLAKLFVQFCYSDAQLQAFTVNTGVAKGVAYELTSQQEASLSFFANNLWNTRKNADIVFPVSSNPIYVNNQSAFSWNIGGTYWSTTIAESGVPYRQPINALRENITSRAYFEGMAVAQTAWNSKYSAYFTA